jgi:trimethylamine--corrinoid protein Co-methyltransferase
MDVDRCGAIFRMTQGLTIDANELAADAYLEAGIGNNFLGVAHTLRNFRTANYRAPLADTSSFEQWSEDGRKDMQQRAYARWNQMLSEYESPAIDPAIDEALLDFIARKKASMADAWY